MLFNKTTQYLCTYAYTLYVSAYVFCVVPLFIAFEEAVLKLHVPWRGAIESIIAHNDHKKYTMK